MPYVSDRQVEVTTKRIRVSALDMKMGCPGDAHACPVWRAIRRHLKCDAELAVRPAHIELDNPFVWISLPDSAESFIRTYDKDEERHECKPTSFLLPLPDKWLRRPKGGKA